MIKQILTIIWNQRKGNFFILSELLFVSICLWYIVDYMGSVYVIENVPLGFNIENTYRIDVNELTADGEGYISPENKTTTTGEDLLFVMERIRQYPAVESVSLSVASQPYAATAYSQSFHKQLIYEDTGITAQEFRVTPSFFDVFRTQLTDESKKDLKETFNTHAILLSSNVAEELFKDNAAVGKKVIVGENGQEKQIEALYVPVRWTEYFNARYSFYTLLSEDEIAETVNPDNLARMELCVRVKPDMSYNFIDNFISDMARNLRVGNVYLMDVRPTSYIRDGALGPERSTIQVRSILLVFLLINIFLGISGTFGLRTQQRKSELGLRMAVGSSKLKLQTIVIIEGLLLLCIVIPGVMFIAANMGLFELVNIDWLSFSFVRFLSGIIITYIIMAIIILTGIWYPAYKTAKINPAETLRNE